MLIYKNYVLLLEQNGFEKDYWKWIALFEEYKVYKMKILGKQISQHIISFTHFAFSFS